jgi:twitching motility protein PilT
MYSHDEQDILRERFAENLAVIMSQDLLDRIDGPGRVAVYEILIATGGVKTIIERGTLSQLRTAMENGTPQGMITMDNYAYQLAENGIISKADSNQYVPRQ